MQDESDLTQDIGYPPLLPPPEPRNPFEVFMILWIMLASLSLTAGNSGSAVLDHKLDDKDVILWGIALMAGSVMTSLGMILQKWTRDGLVWERTGLILVGGAAVVYSYVILKTAPEASDVRYSSGVQIGLACACVKRAWDITKRLRWLRSVRDYQGG